MLPSLLEKSFELKAQDYEKQLQSLREETLALQREKAQLQRELEEERVAREGLKGEVARLSQQAKVRLGGPQGTVVWSYRTDWGHLWKG